jgi:hypothetical protein
MPKLAGQGLKQPEPGYLESADKIDRPIINRANGRKCIIIRTLSCNPHKIAHT